MQYSTLLASRAVTQCDWLLALYCLLSVCLNFNLSVMLCIVALRVSVRG